MCSEKVLTGGGGARRANWIRRSRCEGGLHGQGVDGSRRAARSQETCLLALIALVMKKLIDSEHLSNTPVLIAQVQDMLHWIRQTRDHQTARRGVCFWLSLAHHWSKKY